METLTAYALLSPENVLQLGAVFAKRENAERARQAEYPPGCPIYRDCRVVEIQIKIIGP
jgi:hypothetical protein